MDISSAEWRNVPELTMREMAVLNLATLPTDEKLGGGPLDERNRADAGRSGHRMIYVDMLTGIGASTLSITKATMTMRTRQADVVSFGFGTMTSLTRWTANAIRVMCMHAVLTVHVIRTFMQILGVSMMDRDFPVDVTGIGGPQHSLGMIGLARVNSSRSKQIWTPADPARHTHSNAVATTGLGQWVAIIRALVSMNALMTLLVSMNVARLRFP